VVDYGEIELNLFTNILTNVVNLAGSGKKLTKSTDKIHIKSELTKRSLQNN